MAEGGGSLGMYLEGFNFPVTWPPTINLLSDATMSSLSFIGPLDHDASPHLGPQQ